MLVQVSEQRLGTGSLEEGAGPPGLLSHGSQGFPGAPARASAGANCRQGDHAPPAPSLLEDSVTGAKVALVAPASAPFLLPGPPPPAPTPTLRQWRFTERVSGQWLFSDLEASHRHSQRAVCPLLSWTPRVSRDQGRCHPCLWVRVVTGSEPGSKRDHVR